MQTFGRASTSCEVKAVLRVWIDSACNAPANWHESYCVKWMDRARRVESPRLITLRRTREFCWHLLIQTGSVDVDREEMDATHSPMAAEPTLPSHKVWRSKISLSLSIWMIASAMP